MTMRQGYTLTFPDGRVTSDGGRHSDRNKTIARLVRTYGARVEWGPEVVPFHKKKARKSP